MQSLTLAKRVPKLKLTPKNALDVSKRFNESQQRSATPNDLENVKKSIFCNDTSSTFCFENAYENKSTNQISPPNIIKPVTLFSSGLVNTDVSHILSKSNKDFLVVGVIGEQVSKNLVI